MTSRNAFRPFVRAYRLCTANGMCESYSEEATARRMLRPGYTLYTLVGTEWVAA